MHLKLKRRRKKRKKKVLVGSWQTVGSFSPVGLDSTACVSGGSTPGSGKQPGTAGREPRMLSGETGPHGSTLRATGAPKSPMRMGPRSGTRQASKHADRHLGHDIIYPPENGIRR